MPNCSFAICFCFPLFTVGLPAKDDPFNACEKVNPPFNYRITNNVKSNWEISFPVRRPALKVYE